MLPAYITQTKPNPASNRAPWFTNTAPTYAGVFLWIVFYQTMAQGTIDRASLGVCIAALAAAGLICYALFYYVPGMLGMKTGFPLYVIGSSTFGTLGGYPMPGLFMGLLQVGWFAVGTFTSTRFILMGLGLDPTAGTPTFWLVAALWAYIMATIGILGIQYVAHPRHPVRRPRLAVPQRHSAVDDPGRLLPRAGRHQPASAHARR